MESSGNEKNKIVKDVFIGNDPIDAILSFSSAIDKNNTLLLKIAENTKSTADYLKDRDGLTSDFDSVVNKISVEVARINAEQTKNLIIKYFSIIGAISVILGGIFWWISNSQINALIDQLKHLQ